MKDENKTKTELIKELKTLRKEREKSALNDITERKQAEQELQIERDKLTAIFESMADGIYVVNKDYDFQYVNPALQKIFGSPEGKKCHEYFHDSDEPCTFCKNEDVFAGKTVHWEWIFSKYNKTYDIIETPMKNADGSMSKLDIFRDITERKRAEKELKDSEEYLKILFDYAPDAYYISDLKGKFIDGNKAAERLMGYKKEELVGKSFLKLNLLTLAAIPKAAKLLVKNLKGQPTGPDEFVLNRKDNSKVTVEISTYPVKIKERTVVLGIARDITEQKKATEEIEKLAKFPTKNPNPVLRISKDGTVLYHNSASESLLEHWNYKEGKPLQDRWYHLVLDALEDDDIKTVETEIADKVISLTFAPIVEKGFVNVYGLDITERKRAEKKIKNLNLILRSIRNINQLIVREKNRDVLLQKICDVLTKARGYNTAWLGFLKDEKTFDTVVASPLKELSSFCAQVLRGDHPPCIKKALTKKDLFMFVDRSRDCGDFPLKKSHLGKNSLLMRIAYKSKLFGFLVLSLEPDVFLDQEEKGLLEEVASDIAFGLHNIELDENLSKRTHELKERVKELNCLWEISNLIEKPDISLEAIIKGTVNLLPSAWQYPQISCARIILEAKEYKTKNFKETVWKQASDIILHQKPIGTVEVYYLEERSPSDEGPFLKEERNLINIIAERLGNLIEGEQSEIKLQQSYQKLQKTMEDTIFTIGKIVEVKDPYTAGHQQKVSQLATAIAKELNLSQDKIAGIRIASLVHDIGKISLPAEILNKPIKLSEIEYSLIKDHSQVGYDVLKSIDFPWPVAQIVLQHHERLNGSGYPQGLKGEDILMEAKIIGVADVIEAMSSHRPYRPALGIDKVLEEISKNKGILYDPEAVDVCIKLFKEKRI